MQVVFLGGASGVGASCLAVEIGREWILVDAGVRVDRAADRLPDLAFLEDKQLAAIFVTHAHADHIGSLPLVHQRFPHVPIYTSVATMRLSTGRSERCALCRWAARRPSPSSRMSRFTPAAPAMLRAR